MFSPFSQPSPMHVYGIYTRVCEIYFIAFFQVFFFFIYQFLATRSEEIEGWGPKFFLP